MKNVATLVLNVALLLTPAKVVAQESWPVGVQLVLGPGRGFSIEDEVYRGEQSGAFASLLAMVRLHSPQRSGIIAGLELGGYYINTIRDDSCLLAPDGGCIPHFPGLGGVALLAGWESRATRLQVLGGAVLVDPEYDRTIGITARADFVLPLFLRFSAVASASSLYVPSWNGDGFYYLGLGVGLRVR